MTLTLIVASSFMVLKALVRKSASIYAASWGYKTFIIKVASHIESLLTLRGLFIYCGKINRLFREEQAIRLDSGNPIFENFDPISSF